MYKSFLRKFVKWHNTCIPGADPGFWLGGGAFFKNDMGFWGRLKTPSGSRATPGGGQGGGATGSF